MVTTPYPSDLHEEAAKAGIVPHLYSPVERFAGNIYLVEMEHLAKEHGWTLLAHFNGDWVSAKSVLQNLLETWQACCNGMAVHGDLRPPNILLR